MNKPIATTARTREILNKYDLRAKKGYGQNFITDVSVVARMADSTSCRGTAVEIGPGIGSLTEQLAQRFDRVIAYEIDERLREVLADTLQEYPNVEIRFGDFLAQDLEDVIREAGEITVAANLPYYITTPVLFKLFEYGQKIPDITVMVQKEVADRFTALPGTKEYSALSVEGQYLYTIKRLFTVPRTSFSPSPNVDSAVVQFLRRPETEDIPVGEFFAFVRECFKQRRKTLLNNLKENYGSEKSAKILANCGFPASVRPQELNCKDYVRLYQEVDHD